MKKRLLALFLAFVLMLGLMPVSAFAAGETEIGNQSELAAMGSGSYILTQDITLDSWSAMDFSGTLNGNGHTITLDGTKLFNSMSGTVTNLILKGSVVEMGNLNVGALCKDCSGGTIRNCISDVAVTYSGASSYTYVGQITGTFNSSSKISNCLLLGSVAPGNATLYGAAGGAFFTNLNISNCVAAGYDYLAWNEGFPNTPITGTGCTLVASDAYSPADYLEAFNANRGDDMEWALVDGALALKAVAAGNATQEQIDALKAAIAAAEAIDTAKLYTSTSWSSYQSALSAAKSKAEEPEPTASSV